MAVSQARGAHSVAESLHWHGFSYFWFCSQVCPTSTVLLQCNRSNQLAHGAAHSDDRYCLVCRCAFETGLASQGASIANCGLATTPAMFFSCVATGHLYDGGVMATASHLPYNRNGLKFFTKHGGAFSISCCLEIDALM